MNATAEAAENTEAENTEESNVTDLRSNSKELKEFILKQAEEVVDIMSIRKACNKRYRDVREALKDKGVDTKAFDDVVAKIKKRPWEREGYDDSYTLCWDTLNTADTIDMFDFTKKDD